MRTSEDRILTSHTGSLHMPPDLKDLLLQDFRGGRQGAPGLEERLRSAVDEVVQRQSDLGIDVVNDGEFSKPTWSGYAIERIAGFELRDKPDTGDEWAANEQTPESKDVADFPGYYSEAGLAQMVYIEPGAAMDMFTEIEDIEAVVTGPVSYKGQSAIERDIDNLRGSLERADVVEAFMPAVAPGSVYPMIQNEYYDDDESLFAGLADALSAEYRAIVDAGMILQIDDAYLPYEWDRRSLEKDWTLKRYRDWANLSVEALNAALAGIPEDRIRYHLCWGSWNGPHSTDIPLADIVDIVLKVNAQTYSVEAANARHEFEYKVWNDVKLPDGKILMPGVIEHHTNIIEHPETVADRILRFANIVGRENVIAGTDCGFRDRVHPEIAWAKLRSLSEGAEIASKELWK